MPRRRALPRVLVLAALGAFILADLALVVFPVQRDMPAFTIERRTLIKRRFATYRTPDVQITAESVPSRLLYGDDATQARERGEQNWQANITWPFPREGGLFTPFYKTCRFSFSGWDDETSRLRADLAARVNADPAFGALPEWCREAMTNESGRTTKVVWRLLVHDLILGAAMLAFGALGFTTMRRGVRAIMMRRPGRCRACGYDLAGLTTTKCPECGAERG